MEELLRPYVFYPVTVIIVVSYSVLGVPKESLSVWWKLLALGLVWILAHAAVAGVIGYGAPELLTFRARGTWAGALRMGVATGYTFFFVGCGLLVRSLWRGSRDSRSR